MAGLEVEVPTRPWPVAPAALVGPAAMAGALGLAVPAVPVVTVWRELRVRMPPLSADPAAMAVLAAAVVPAGTAARAAPVPATAAMAGSAATERPAATAGTALTAS
ncbi:hypothetical protein YM3MPS_13460 [Mycobacterium pseudoshottsii]|nr:hypothetical protein YM3MPS_13460 [Mycobacterium pseudoshottsii]